jgi:hypothetical protein
VSGDAVLVDGGDGGISRLVRTAGRVFALPGFTPAALVGGLTVTARLATVHRATNDIDAVADGESPGEALELVGERASAERGRVTVDGVKIDVMPTSPIAGGELPDDELDRLFVIGHRWALDTATPLTIHVADQRGSRIESASINVATVPALVACKLHAIADRREARAEKRESDAGDLLRLVRDLARTPDATGELAAAPFGLAQLVSAQIERWFIDGRLRFARLARLGGATGQVGPADVEALGRVVQAMIHEVGS